MGSTVAKNQLWTRISDITEPEWNGSAQFKYISGRGLEKPSFNFEFVGQISPITPDIAARITYSWKDNNPVPQKDLRLLSLSHYGYDGLVHQGELMVHQQVAAEVVEIFKEIFEAKFPIQRMHLVDVYEADGLRSMADNNSSAFCSRPITGQQNAFSRHSYGLAIDINPFYNPYIKNGTILPIQGTHYADRTKLTPGTINIDSPVYKAFAKRGWTWGGNWDKPYLDLHHFEKDPSILLSK